MIDLSDTISVITLNVNGLSTPIKNQIRLNKNHDPTMVIKT